MGFKPGEALGKQPEREDKPFGAKEEPVEVEEGISAPLQQDAQPSRRGIGGGGGGGGMGFARASFVPAGAGGSGSGFSPLPPPPVVPKPAPPPPPAVEKPRTEPLKFEMRTGAFIAFFPLPQLPLLSATVSPILARIARVLSIATLLTFSLSGRTGLGIPQQTRARPFPSHLLPNSSSEPLPDLSEYLSHLKSSMDTRRAFGLLRSARRTCEELDRRAGIDENVMWRDPEEEKREEEGRQRRRLFDRLDGELEEEEERKARVEGRRKKSELEYEKGESGTVVDGESDKEGVGGGAGPRGADEAEWLELDVRFFFSSLFPYDDANSLAPLAGSNSSRTHS